VARRAHRDKIAQRIWTTGRPVMRIPIPGTQAARAARSLVITDLHRAFATPACALVKLLATSLTDGHIGLHVLEMRTIEDNNRHAPKTTLPTQVGLSSPDEPQLQTLNDNHFLSRRQHHLG